MLNQLTDHITEVLDVSGAGVSLLDETNQLRFVTASSAMLIEAEQTQERLQQGPCVDAVVTGDIVKSADLHREARWPELRPVLTAVVVPSRGRDPAAVRGSPARQLEPLRLEAARLVR